MARFDIVHTQAEGEEIIIIPLRRSFGDRSEEEQIRLVGGFQQRAAAANLNGVVVPVWNGGGTGTMLFMAPERLHAFLRSIDFEWVTANINKSLQWDSAPKSMF